MGITRQVLEATFTLTEGAPDRQVRAARKLYPVLSPNVKGLFLT
jgi:hypothetical protein